MGVGEAGVEHEHGSGVVDVGLDPAEAALGGSGERLGLGVCENGDPGRRDGGHALVENGVGVGDCDAVVAVFWTKRAGLELEDLAGEQAAVVGVPDGVVSAWAGEGVCMEDAFELGADDHVGGPEMDLWRGHVHEGPLDLQAVGTKGGE
ncbi:hypothetical protein ES708_27302 [subsurface metagenome]